MHVYFKPFITLTLVAISTLVYSPQLSAYRYTQERAAWGGNGGWWGGGNEEFYEDYPWRNEDSYASCQNKSCRHTYVCPECGQRHCGAPPQNEYEYNDTVPGAGAYFNIAPRQCPPGGRLVPPS